MTKITSETKTYTPIDGKMVHTGYFITSDNYRLKQILKNSWHELKASPRFKVDLDGIISSLQDAQ